MSEWLPIESAPKDGTAIRAKGPLTTRVRQMPGSILPGQRTRTSERVTWWGKTSHVPIYGWNWGSDVEDLNLWSPTHWRPK